MHMEKLPAEIILAIGRFLRPPALISSLQVCQRWHLILHSLVWKFIRERHWHHPYFPLREERLITVSAAVQAGEEKEAQVRETQVRETQVEKETTALDDPQLSGLLVNVYSLRWRYFRVIAGVPRRETRRISPLTLDTLERIFLLAPNLVILSLFISVKFSSSRVDPLTSLIATLHGLTRLKDLSLYIKGYEDDSPVAVEDLFPLFSRLNKLSFGGSWVTSERQQWESENDGAGAEGQGRGIQETLQSWKVRELQVDMRFLSLTRHCPALYRLETNYLAPTSNSISFSLRPLSRCLQLEELSLPYDLGVRRTLDTPTHLPALGKLKTLVIPLTKLEDMEFLNMPTGSSKDETLDSRLVLPLLETLHFGSSRVAHTDDVRLQLAFRQFLMLRTRLKVLYLASLYIDPLHVFAQPGMELQHGWACVNLESITLKLPGIYPWMVRITSRDYRIQMNSVYRQLGCLPRLHTLSIECDSSYEFHVPAILQLRGATALWKLTLNEVKGWTREGIAMLVEGVPGLKALNLSFDIPNEQDVVKGWLKEFGLPDMYLARV